METRGDGGGGSITSENVALEHPRVFVSRHVGKIPATEEEHVKPAEADVHLASRRSRVKSTERASNTGITNTPLAKSVLSGSMKLARPPDVSDVKVNLDCLCECPHVCLQGLI